MDAVAHCQSAGIERVGENRVQEARAKQEQISGVKWDLIGHLQSNKINQVVGNFARIQTVDSVKLIKKLQIAAENKVQKCDIFLQVNAGNDPAKYGFMVDEVTDALDQVLESPSLKIEGLMTIAPLLPKILRSLNLVFSGWQSCGIVCRIPSFIPSTSFHGNVGRSRKCAGKVVP